MLDLWLIFVVGFLGSFGHCVGMCGPLTVAFSLSYERSLSENGWRQQFYFHGLLNLGRIVSYALVGAGIGALGSVLVASGQLAGIDSQLRQGITIFTGILLIWMGLLQIKPGLMPSLPFLHPILQGSLHKRLSAAMMALSQRFHWATPLLLGLVWGLIPCGFLYVAQVKAAATGSLWAGCATMLAFGLGTFPATLGVGVSASRLSADRRSQLFRLGGWVTLTIGVLTLLRTGDMVDYTGDAALFCLMLALVARPISGIWAFPMRYRRALGVGAFILSLAHTLHMVDHSLQWNFNALPFMLPIHQVGMVTGGVSLFLMMPLAFTSFDRAMARLGKLWRQVHLLAIPAAILAVFHTVAIGANYLGDLEWTDAGRLRTILLCSVMLLVMLIRCRWFWSIFHLEKFYVSSHQSL